MLANVWSRTALLGTAQLHLQHCGFHSLFDLTSSNLIIHNAFAQIMCVLYMEFDTLPAPFYHILLVTYMYKPDSCAEVPESQHSIPRSRESKLSIAADHNIRDKVFVPMETALGYTIVGLKFHTMIISSGEESSSVM